jgi:hypothetical protein
LSPQRPNNTLARPSLVSPSFFSRWSAAQHKAQQITSTTNAYRAVPKFGTELEEQAEKTRRLAQGTFEKTPPTPYKKRRVVESDQENLFKAWQEGITWTPLKMAHQGNVMSVFVDAGKRYVLKFPSEHRVCKEKSEASIITRMVNSQKELQKKGYPVAPILNANEAVHEGRIIMTYFPILFNPADAEHLAQYQELVDKAEKDQIAIDIKPANLRIDSAGKIVLIDWDAEEGVAARECIFEARKLIRT